MDLGSCGVFTLFEKNGTETPNRKCKLLYMKRSKATLLVYKYDPGAAQTSLNVNDLIRLQVKLLCIWQVMCCE